MIIFDVLLDDNFFRRCSVLTLEQPLRTSITTDRLEGNRLFLYTQKMGVPVNTILPEFVLSALEATPKVTDTFFFGVEEGSWKASCGAGKRNCANSSNSQTFRTDMHTVSATHSLSNCFSPVCPLNEFRYCWAIKV